MVLRHFYRRFERSSFKITGIHTKYPIQYFQHRRVIVGVLTRNARFGHVDGSYLQSGFHFAGILGNRLLQLLHFRYGFGPLYCRSQFTRALEKGRNLHR